MSDTSDELRLINKDTGVEHRPMLRVTVMMFRDIVESVTLLKEEAWRRKQGLYNTIYLNTKGTQNEKLLGKTIPRSLLKISFLYAPSPAVGGAVSSVGGGVSEASRLCSAPLHC